MIIHLVNYSPVLGKAYQTIDWFMLRFIVGDNHTKSIQDER